MLYKTIFLASLAVASAADKAIFDFSGAIDCSDSAVQVRLARAHMNKHT